MLDTAVARYKLDVIVPTYNRPRLLYQLLQSIVACNIQGLRTVVLDDGSTLTEEIPDVGLLSTKEVCQSFAQYDVLYVPLSAHAGLPEALATYYQRYCVAEYTLLVRDKDRFIKSGSIERALNKLDQDPLLSMVQIPVFRQDHLEEDAYLIFPPTYQRMPGTVYLERYVREQPLQHSGMFGILRVEAIRRAAVPRSLNLRAYGLEDAFGLDIDFLMSVAVTGDVDFEHEPHILPNWTGGLTEKYPLTFAYCYYQYAKRIMKELRKKRLVSRRTVKIYLTWWHLLILRGLSVIYQPSESRVEKDTSRLHTHLKVPLIIYLIWQYMIYRIWPRGEMRGLLLDYIKRLRNSVCRKISYAHCK